LRKGDACRSVRAMDRLIDSTDSHFYDRTLVGYRTRTVRTSGKQAAQPNESIITIDNHCCFVLFCFVSFRFVSFRLIWRQENIHTRLLAFTMDVKDLKGDLERRPRASAWKPKGRL